MAEKLTALVIDESDILGQKVKLVLESMEGLDVRVGTASLAQGYDLARLHRPNIIFLNLYPTLDGALSLGEKLTHGVPDATLIVTSNESDPELILRAMRIGARDFLSQPFSEADLVKVVEKSLSAPLQKTGTRSIGGEILGIFSNKGGLGKSCIAVNLATALSLHLRKSTVIVDLELQLGDITTLLDLQPRYSIADVARNITRLDANFMKGCLVTHSSGLAVLADPFQPVEAEAITPEQIGEILKLLKTMFHYVVVDLSHTFDEKSLMALDMADSIFLVTALNLSAIRKTQRSLEIFEQLNYAPDTVKLIVNRYAPGEEIAKEDLEKVLNRGVFWALPNDHPTIISAINQGRSVLETAPQSALAQSFLDLAYKITGQAREDNEPGPQKGGLLRKIFASRRSA